jgi:5'-3' exonuclease
MPMEPTRILLIDVSHLFWSSWHATKDEAVGSAFELTVARVAELRQGFDFVAVCCDSPPYKRKELSPEYKANREAAPPVAHAQFDRVKARLVSDGFLLWSVPGHEADDVIATATKRALGLDEPVRVTIASNDKDLLQLVRDPSVEYVSTATGKLLTEAAVIEKFGVKPEQMTDFLALIGDKSDNIDGVPSVGPKHAAKLLGEHGDLEKVLAAATIAKEAADSLGGAKIPAVIRAVAEHADAARLARKLVALDDSLSIGFDDIFERREPQKLTETNVEDLDATDDVDDVLGPPVVLAPLAKAEPPKPEPEATAPSSAIAERPAANGHAPPDALAKAMPFEMQLQPVSLKAAAALGAAIFNSRMFPKLPSADAVTAVILRGREMGITALTACQVFHFFEGQLVMHAHLITAKVEEHPDCEYFSFIGGDDTFAEYETKSRRKKTPTRLKYTIEQAKQAGLCPEEIRLRNPSPGEKDRRGNWEKRPAEMLRKTCAVQLGRIEYPSAALGLYSLEEVGGEA